MAVPTRPRRADTVTLSALASAALIGIIAAARQRAVSLFESNPGIAWHIAIDEMPVQATIDSETGSVSTVDGHGTVHAAHVNATSTTMFAASVAASTLVALVALVRGVVPIRGAMRGHLFRVWTVRAWSIAEMTLIAGGGIMMFCDTLKAERRAGRRRHRRRRRECGGRAVAVCASVDRRRGLHPDGCRLPPQHGVAARHGEARVMAATTHVAPCGAGRDRAARRRP